MLRALILLLMVGGRQKGYRLMRNIGFMQGRLSSIIDGKIQAFPWTEWQDEFPRAQEIGLSIMEWTLDFKNLKENPLMSKEGRDRISILAKKHNVSIPSLTGDCFMQKPFWKAKNSEAQGLLSIFDSVINACQQLGIKMILIPLVDNGKIENPQQEKILIDACLKYQPYLEKYNMTLMFESDYPPSELFRFINLLPKEQYGINYDIGNSAALGYDPYEEFKNFGNRIINIHVKDRMLNGTTVPLGEGNADFNLVFKLIKEINYNNNFILQTARSYEGNHEGVLLDYKNMVAKWINIDEV